MSLRRTSSISSGNAVQRSCRALRPCRGLRDVYGERFMQAARPPLSHIMRLRATTVSAASVNIDTRHVTENNDVMIRTFCR